MTKRLLPVLMVAWIAVPLLRAGRIAMAETVFQSPPDSPLPTGTPSPPPPPPPPPTWTASPTPGLVASDPTATLSPELMTKTALVVTAVLPIEGPPTSTPFDSPLRTPACPDSPEPPSTMPPSALTAAAEELTRSSTSPAPQDLTATAIWGHVYDMTATAQASPPALPPGDITSPPTPEAIVTPAARWTAPPTPSPTRAAKALLPESGDSLAVPCYLPVILK